MQYANLPSRQYGSALPELCIWLRLVLLFISVSPPLCLLFDEFGVSGLESVLCGRILLASQLCYRLTMQAFVQSLHDSKPADFWVP